MGCPLTSNYHNLSFDSTQYRHNGSVGRHGELQIILWLCENNNAIDYIDSLVSYFQLPKFFRVAGSM